MVNSFMMKEPRRYNGNKIGSSKNTFGETGQTHVKE